MPFRRKITRSKPCVVSISLLAVFIIGITDYLTPIEISLAIFYLLPISFVTWFAGWKEGMMISSVAAVIWLTGDFLLVERNLSYPAVPYWNAIMQDGVFIVIVLLLSRVKVALLREKEISRLKSEMLSQIGHLNLAVTSSLDLADVGKSLLDTIELFFPEWSTTLALVNEHTGALESFVSRIQGERGCTKELVGWRGTREVLETNANLVLQNTKTDPQHDWVSYLGLPLVATGDMLDVLSIFTNQKHDFTNEEIAFFNTLAGQAVIALKNARLFEEVRKGHAQLKELSHRLLDVQETDRRHIARELHDEVGQVLTGLQMTLEMAGRSPHEEAGIKLAKAQSLVNDLIRRVRGISLDLRPSMLDDLGLLPTLLWHIERYTSITEVKVDFCHDGLENKRFISQVETSAYRIVQEALTNIARHARVDRATVYIWCMPDTLILKVQDDGAGFDPQAAPRNGKTDGLTGMRERAKLLGGELNIESASGTGTCIIAELPLQETFEAVITDEQGKHTVGR